MVVALFLFYQTPSFAGLDEIFSSDPGVHRGRAIIEFYKKLPFRVKYAPADPFRDELRPVLRETIAHLTASQAQTYRKKILRGLLPIFLAVATDASAEDDIRFLESQLECTVTGVPNLLIECLIGFFERSRGDLARHQDLVERLDERLALLLKTVMAYNSQSAHSTPRGRQANEISRLEALRHRLVCLKNASQPDLISPVRAHSTDHPLLEMLRSRDEAEVRKGLSLLKRHPDLPGSALDQILVIASEVSRSESIRREAMVMGVFLTTRSAFHMVKQGADRGNFDSLAHYCSLALVFNWLLAELDQAISQEPQMRKIQPPSL